MRFRGRVTIPRNTYIVVRYVSVYPNKPKMTTKDGVMSRVRSATESKDCCWECTLKTAFMNETTEQIEKRLEKSRETVEEAIRHINKYQETIDRSNLERRIIQQELSRRRVAPTSHN